jgi:peptidoglycan/LPS O-acetylase OafA/YrhL
MASPAASSAPPETGDLPTHDKARPEPKGGRVPGLDTLRFFLASWVVFCHAGFLPIARFGSNSVYGVFSRLAFNGSAAVMIFFLISGFCIHLPFAHGRRIDPVPFYLRREVRILPPVAAMFILSAIARDFSFVMVLWSLVCEEVYYCIYPGLSRIIKRFGFRNLLLASAVIAAILVACRVRRIDDDLQYQSYWFAWAMCLPIWLLGALLAENLLTIREAVVPRWRVWAWRLGFWAFSAAAVSFSHHHVPITYSLLFMGAMAYFWLRDEIAYFHRNPPPEWLEKVGLASYTLYLTHMIVVAKLGLNKEVAPTLQWLLGMGLIAAFVAVFYFAIERPSHRSARAIARHFEHR